MIRKVKSKQFRKILYQDVRLNLNRFVYIYGIISFPLIFNAVNFSLGCAGCGEDIRSGQSLLALEKQWHLWCFTCTKCGCLLAGEYMGRLVQSHIISIFFFRSFLKNWTRLLLLNCIQYWASRFRVNLFCHKLCSMEINHCPVAVDNPTHKERWHFSQWVLFLDIPSSLRFLR